MQICLISMLKNAKWQESTKLSYHFIFESTIIQCKLNDIAPGGDSFFAKTAICFYTLTA